MFFYIIYIFCCNAVGPQKKLDFLFITEYSVIKCSENEYLVIYSRPELYSMNISCPNQIDLFENQSLNFFDWRNFQVKCHSEQKQFHVYSTIDDPPSINKNTKKIKDMPSLLTGTINATNYNGILQAKIKKNQISIDHGWLDWSSDGFYDSYVTFSNHPIICRIHLNLAERVENGKCTDKLGTRAITCYYEPKSDAPLKMVDWQEIDNFIYNESYSPSNWTAKGGYYLDVRLLKTNSTSVSCLYLVLI
jgi:hypothetical protein